MKQKQFKEGDKVFAKVKGYHAWPAIITKVNLRNYSVRFYGTGEVGNCKSQDIYYYLKHREKYTKNQKRQEYLDAVEEIDIAIAECGGEDGNSENIDTASNSEASFNSSVEDVNSKKRTSDSNTIQPKKKRTAAEKKLKKNVEQDRNSVSASDLRNKSVSRECSPAVTSKKQTSKTSSLPKSVANEPRLTISDIKVVTPQYLNIVSAYAEHVQKQPEIYKNLPQENRYSKRNELILANLGSGKLVGIKYNRDEDTIFDSEYDRAMYDSEEAATMLSMKNMLESGQCSPEDDPAVFETNLDITDTQVQESIELAVIENKKRKLDWLKIETKLAELDAEIKKHLGLEKASPDRAEQYLCELLTLKVEALMLLKHPSVFDMVKRLRKYVGNVYEWNYTNEECEKFDALAEKVREKAAAVYNKFVDVLKYSGNDDPWNYYIEQVARFKDQVSDMVECKVFALTAPPTSRAAFFDSIEDEEELKEMVDKLGKNTMNSTTHLYKK